ncbi:MAG TPA: family 20 glycosylhydrolase [Bryobacteraceae bacterium]|nr:family 20 glycosylhydrolase [Bryobacteraceae bacterium]
MPLTKYLALRGTGFSLCCFAALLTGATAAASPNLMPWPSTLVQGEGALAINAGFAVDARDCADARVHQAIERLTTRLIRQTGLAIGVQAAGNSAFIVECGPGPDQPSLKDDESYRLDVTPQRARLTAPAPAGALHGLETFAQLVVAGDAGFEAAAVHIEDRPRFPWRGLMLDVSRHWMPVPVIKRNLDGMAAVKMNVFHWHLTDDQGFRVESKVFPRLHQFGSDGHYYTQAEVHQVLEYARQRGIRVIPEFDMPGHTTSWFAGMPELATLPGTYQIERSWGVFAPALDPTRESTYVFLDAFIGEMAALFPDPFFHIGGDEVDDTQWKNSTSVQAFSREHGIRDSLELHAYFNQRLAALVKKHGKIMIGWDEVLRPGLSRDTVIQSWRGQESLAEAARQGYRSVLSFGYYLDYLKPASFHYANDPLSGEAGRLTAEQASRILGGEACMWTEYMNFETVDSRIWPRTAAIAERLWSPGEITNPDSMYTRLQAVSAVLDRIGLRHRSNEDPMLNVIAAGRPAEPLRVLADAVEALGIAGRRDVRHYTSLVPLNRLVDASHPESEQIRELEQAAIHGEYPELKAAFTQWTANRALVAPLASNDFLVRELLPLSADLSTIGSIGLSALKYLEQDLAAPEKWIADQRKTLSGIDTAKLEVTPAAIRPVQRLLDVLERKSAQPNAGGGGSNGDAKP